MAGVKQRGVRSENYKRTVVRDGEEIEIKPVKYYGPGANGRMCGAFADTGELILGSDGLPKPFKSIQLTIKIFWTGKITCYHSSPVINKFEFK